MDRAFHNDGGDPASDSVSVACARPGLRAPGRVGAGPGGLGVHPLPDLCAPWSGGGRGATQVFTVTPTTLRNLPTPPRVRLNARLRDWAVGAKLSLQRDS